MHRQRAKKPDRKHDDKPPQSNETQEHVDHLENRFYGEHGVTLNGGEKIILLTWLALLLPSKQLRQRAGRSLEIRFRRLGH